MKKFLFLCGILLIIPTSLSNLKVPIGKPFKNKKHQIHNDLIKFMNRLSILESDGNSRAINKYGRMGKYQFDMGTISMLGINTTREEFLNNSKLQDSTLILFLKDNRRSLSKVIKEFSNTTYDGIPITRSGILAAAHFAGPIGVLAYFYPDDSRWSKGKTKDANGATVQLYLQKFANYNLGI